MERPLVSNALEVIERLEAIAALVLRLAWRRAELAHPCGVLGLAARARDDQGLAQEAIEGGRRFSRILGWRSDAIGFELAPSALTDPVRRPGRREPAFDPQPINAFHPQGRLYVEGDDAGRGTARIGR